MTTSKSVLPYINSVLKNMPADWLNLTTHRLDVYNEELAKTEFLDHFEALYARNDAEQKSLSELPTAYDYIRLGHPLSCILEWVIARTYNSKPQNVISFSSKAMPIFAVLRKNLLSNTKTRIVYKGETPSFLHNEVLTKVYGYKYELAHTESLSDLNDFEGTTVFVSERDDLCDFDLNPKIDVAVNYNRQLGSVLLVNAHTHEDYTSEIQHVRRRESIAMTPSNTLIALHRFVGDDVSSFDSSRTEQDKSKVLQTINNITGTTIKPLIASSGLSMQYGIVMGLVHHAIENHPGKAIKIVVPPNCYGGTNDQARRVAACIDNAEVVDLPVDGDNDMVNSVDEVLDNIATLDGVPFIIAEIPTNPRVEVPDLHQLNKALCKPRLSNKGTKAIDPVFILDQTFCPNTHFLGEQDVLSAVQTISYVSGSKFPSGGKCTAGYCVANTKAAYLMENIDFHLKLCDNQATPLQVEILAKQMPSMTDRIQHAYENTREFVNHISNTLPDAKINFVSEELAEAGFTPSVFSLDLPTKGSSEEEKESYKRMLNHKLISLMIHTIPTESKYCVSYGQLKGCYWTIPATSTQGTTKEGDKDYIARVAVSPDLNLEQHKQVFTDFVNTVIKE